MSPRDTDCGLEFFATSTLVAQTVMANSQNAIPPRRIWSHLQSMPQPAMDLHYRSLVRTIQQPTERASATSYMFPTLLRLMSRPYATSTEQNAHLKSMLGRVGLIRFAKWYLP